MYCVHAYMYKDLMLVFSVFIFYRDQFVAWLDDGINGVILPQLMPVGTATRRAVEKTWLTASNAKVYLL